MASYQRVALFILFDAIEQDLVNQIRAAVPSADDLNLSEDELAKAASRLRDREAAGLNLEDKFDLLYGLDLGDKFSVLMRHKSFLPSAASSYFRGLNGSIQKAIPVRNATMHGRPLTTDEYAIGFSLAQQFCKAGGFWPTLAETYQAYSKDPDAILGRSIELLDSPTYQTLNNLPDPDYDDTGFMPRPALESDLKKKICGRHPVITVLGDGGSGKSALALQTMYGLLDSNDHDFDALIWVSAKSNHLTVKDIERIEGAILNSADLLAEVATFEPGEADPLIRVRKLLEENKILLAIDNLETVLDQTLVDLAQDVPGESKLLFTSRVPLGGDLSVVVRDFSEQEARQFLRRLADAHSIDRLKQLPTDEIGRYIKRLGAKPLLLKWFALGVASGLEPQRIVANPEAALRFCLENVVDRLSPQAKKVAEILAILPASASLGIVRHVSDMNATDAENGFNELRRFALIERDERAGEEHTYNIRPFVKSYLTRVLGKLARDSLADVLARYRLVEARFQQGRSQQLAYRHYDYKVRSRSEFVASMTLRQAAAMQARGEFDRAEKIIADLKITNPQYFEVYRAEAQLACAVGNTSRADDAYGAAIDIEPDLPELRLFYAHFLTKFLGDFNRALEQLEEAIRLGSRNFRVYQEAARNCFFLYDFDRAASFLADAAAVTDMNSRDRTVLFDTQAQLHIRSMEWAFQNHEIESAEKHLHDLIELLGSAEPDDVDERFVHHIGKARFVVDQLARMPAFEQSRAVRGYYDWLGEREPEVAESDAPRTGVLREQGRQLNFGFLRDNRGSDTFVHRHDVSPNVWRELWKGSKVQFQIGAGTDGRLRACHIAVVS
jgi:LuxR family transcriptional regulator, glucitol operon activator